jgi:ubiquinone/menaquinone biosynthesis C-methylase UbiE
MPAGNYGLSGCYHELNLSENNLKLQNPQKVKKGFNILAPFYDAGVRLFLGRSVDLSQKEFLPELLPSRTILIFGGGTGSILPELLQRNPGAGIWYVDISERMILAAKKRIVKINDVDLNAVKFICGSYADIPVQNSFDLIITPYILDCFTTPELDVIFPLLSGLLKDGGQWLFCDFHIPQKGVSRIFSSAAVRMLYVFFRLTCGIRVKKLPEFDKYFEVCKFRISREKYFLGGLLTGRVYVRQ